MAGNSVSVLRACANEHLYASSDGNFSGCARIEARGLQRHRVSQKCAVLYSLGGGLRAIRSRRAAREMRKDSAKMKFNGLSA
jgi:hypothetical protein